MKARKAGAKLVDAVAVARDEALIEIGREAALRQEARVGKERRGSAGKVALVAITAGAALTAGAVALRRRRLAKEMKESPPVTLSGKEPEPREGPEAPGAGKQRK
jgi:hypothetical protein